MGIEKKNKTHSNKRENSTSNETNLKEETGYFQSLSKKYKKISKILYISLAVCFLITLLFNAKLLTYKNFNYLFRDLGSAADLASEKYNSISYSNDDLRKTKNFRGGIITASTTDMAIYTATGKKTLTMSESFVEPQIAISKKYAIIYDQGGNNYSIYNSFARVHKETLPQSISYATVCDNGTYAIVSKDNEHASIVYLYDSDFNRISTYSFGSKYVFLISINEKGNLLSIVSLTPSEKGDCFETYISAYEIKTGELKSQVKSEIGTPCGGCFTEKDDYRLVTTDGIYNFDTKSGELIENYSYIDKKLTKISIDKEKCVIILTEGKGEICNSVLVFDRNGNITHKSKISSGIIDVNHSKDYIFINSGDSITRINIKTGKSKTIDMSDNGNDIIVYNNSNILFCCETKAKYIKF